MAYTHRTEHYEQVINAGDIRWSLPRVIWQLEDLRLGMSYPNWYIARLASKFVKCASREPARRIVRRLSWRYYHVFRSLDRGHFLENYYGFWQRLTTPATARRCFARARTTRKKCSASSPRCIGRRRSVVRHARRPDPGALYFECRTFLSGLLLVGDKLSMASGLEERFPFLDNALVDFAMRLPCRTSSLISGRCLKWTKTSA